MGGFALVLQATSVDPKVYLGQKHPQAFAQLLPGTPSAQGKGLLLLSMESIEEMREVVFP